MTAQTLKFEIKLNLPFYVGLSLLIHFLVLAGLQSNEQTGADDRNSPERKRSPINITLLGEKNAKSKNSVYFKPEKPALPQAAAARPNRPRELNLQDLMAPSAPEMKIPSNKAAQLRSTVNPLAKNGNTVRPGQAPAARAKGLSGLKYGSDDFVKMARDELVGGADILTTRKVALNFEVPEGKNENELNESQLKLYGFLRRGAIKYVNSISSEIKEFELKNPHLQFPLVDTKQTLTGRLVYDNKGNLKQIKMVRWSNNDKLQGFFENVLKRLENLQNPPKELWAEQGEFTVFVTLQING